MNTEYDKDKEQALIIHDHHNQIIITSVIGNILTLTIRNKITNQRIYITSMILRTIENSPIDKKILDDAEL